MVLEIIIAAVLIAFGIMSIYFTISMDVKDMRLMLVLIIGAVSLIAGMWLIISTLTLGVVLKKLAGLVLAAFGVFLVVGFPDISEYQQFGFSKAGIFIGIILTVIGAYLLVF